METSKRELVTLSLGCEDLSTKMQQLRPLLDIILDQFDSGLEDKLVIERIQLLIESYARDLEPIHTEMQMQLSRLTAEILNL